MRLPTLLTALFLAIPRTHAQDKPVQSNHRPGPNGLTGWTISAAVPNHAAERAPLSLVITRNGHIVRTIPGQPFVWTWIFLPDGKRVAYELAPFHGSKQCTLSEIDSGKLLATYDCFHEPLAPTAPQWVKDLVSKDE